VNKEPLHNIALDPYYLYLLNSKGEIEFSSKAPKSFKELKQKAIDMT
jgi:hypothetical protein